MMYGKVEKGEWSLGLRMNSGVDEEERFIWERSTEIFSGAPMHLPRR